MGLDELITEAGKADIQVPSDLHEGIERRLGRARRSRSARIRYAVAASLAALLACSAIIRISLDSTQPKDTFEDPELAAIEVQKAFSMISEAFNTGKEQALQSQALINQTTEQINTLLK